MIQVTYRIIPFTNFYQTLDSDFRFLKVLFQFFYNSWSFACFTFRLCRFALLDLLPFRSCRSDKLPFCGLRFNFSLVILCFNLRNLVETLS